MNELFIPMKYIVLNMYSVNIEITIDLKVIFYDSLPSYFIKSVKLFIFICNTSKKFIKS